LRFVGRSEQVAAYAAGICHSGTHQP
jgi:hypothetical protein